MADVLIGDAAQAFLLREVLGTTLAGVSIISLENSQQETALKVPLLLLLAVLNLPLIMASEVELGFFLGWDLLEAGKGWLVKPEVDVAFTHFIDCRFLLVGKL